MKKLLKDASLASFSMDYLVPGQFNCDTKSATQNYDLNDVSE